MTTVAPIRIAAPIRSGTVIGGSGCASHNLRRFAGLAKK